MGGSEFIYAVSDAFRSLRDNLATTVLTSVTIGFALAIFSFFFIVFLNLNSIVSKWGDRTHIVAYVSDSTTAGVEELRKEVLAIEGVRSAEFISKEKALEDLKKELKGFEGVLDGVDRNPLPASFEIRLADTYADSSKLPAVVGRLKGKPWVDDVQYSMEWVEKFSAFLKFIELAAFMVGVFLAVSTLFIISNTIRLTVYARRDEIEIMKLVGATDSFIEFPFFVEGFVQGLLGGVLAFGILMGGVALLAAKMPAYFGFVLSTALSAPSLLLVLASAGVVLGVVGSLVSMARFLKA